MGHPEASSETATGFRTLGRYRIIAELARGGMGVVHLALAPTPGGLSNLLVLKELRPELLGDAHAVSMFLEEGRLSCCLSHRNIVRTLEAGSQGDRHYIVMEYLSGQPLHRFLRRASEMGQPVGLDQLCHIVCEALRGLAYAHNARDPHGKALGIVHRDITPHNVFVGYDGRVRVLDFGIAKAINSTVETRTGIFKGKVAYMAPEQATGGEVDARADVFAVGVSLFEVLTGKRFWSDVSGDGGIFRALILGERPAGQEAGLAEVPEPLAKVVRRATASARTDRFPTATALLHELLAATREAGIGPGSTRELGRLVSTLFAEDRTELQRVVDETLRLDQAGMLGDPADDETQTLSRLVQSSRLKEGAANESGPPSAQGSPTKTAFASRTVRPVPSARRSRWPITLALVAACAGVAGFAAHGRASKAPTTASNDSRLPSPPSAHDPATAARPPDAPPALAATARVIIHALPTNALIVVDGRGAQPSPWIGFLPTGAAKHKVRAEAAGYVPVEETFDVSADTTLGILLEAASAADKTAARAPHFERAGRPAATVTAAESPPTAASIGLSPGVLPHRRLSAVDPYAN